MFNGLRNITAARDAGREDVLRAPEPERKANPLEGHDVALYVDGKRVSHTFFEATTIGDGPMLEIVLETTLEAALNPDVDAAESAAWNGLKPLDPVEYVNGEQFPVGGALQILELLPPKRAGEPAQFRCTALSPVYDYKAQRQIAQSGDEVIVDARFIRRQTAVTSTFPSR